MGATVRDGSLHYFYAHVCNTAILHNIFLLLHNCIKIVENEMFLG